VKFRIWSRTLRSHAGDTRLDASSTGIERNTLNNFDPFRRFMRLELLGPTYHEGPPSGDGLSIVPGHHAAAEGVFQRAAGSGQPSCGGIAGLLLSKSTVDSQALAGPASHPGCGVKEAGATSRQCARSSVLRSPSRSFAVVTHDVESTDAGQAPDDEVAWHGKRLPPAVGNHRNSATQFRRAVRFARRSAMAVEREPCPSNDAYALRS
jgi:hypothetical protein